MCRGPPRAEACDLSQFAFCYLELPFRGAGANLTRMAPEGGLLGRGRTEYARCSQRANSATCSHRRQFGARPLRHDSNSAPCHGSAFCRHRGRPAFEVRIHQRTSSHLSGCHVGYEGRPSGCRIQLASFRSVRVVLNGFGIGMGVNGSALLYRTDHTSWPRRVCVRLWKEGAHMPGWALGSGLDRYCMWRLRKFRDKANSGNEKA